MTRLPGGSVFLDFAPQVPGKWEHRGEKGTAPGKGMMGTDTLVWRQTLKEMSMTLRGECSHTGARPSLWELKEEAPAQANQGRLLGGRDYGVRSRRICCSYPGREEAAGWGKVRKAVRMVLKGLR